MVYLLRQPAVWERVLGVSILHLAVSALTKSKGLSYGAGSAAGAPGQ